MAETAVKDAAKEPVVKKAEVLQRVDPKQQETGPDRMTIPAVITGAEEYDRVYRYLAGRHHVLTPVMAFSGMAPQHGLIMAKVLIDSDPAHGEVYQDRLFCKTGNKDPLDDEVAIAKVGLRKLALAGGLNLQADVMRAERNYWVLRGYIRFVGLDGAVQTFSATEEYDLRDGSPQIRGWTAKQAEAARAHGMRGGEARALNAACREYGIRQKYTRRELQKAFVVLRMMFIPDASNELQMRIVTERALQGMTQMYPQSNQGAPVLLDAIDGMGTPAPAIKDVDGVVVPTPPAAARAVVPGVPDGYVLIRKVTTEEKKRRAGVGTFLKYKCTDSNGEETVTIKKDIAKVLLACWNEQDWTKGRPVEITSEPNDYKEQEITEITALSDREEEPPLPLED